MDKKRVLQVAAFFSKSDAAGAGPNKTTSANWLRSSSARK
jgi:hypothetical protein